MSTLPSRLLSIPEDAIYYAQIDLSAFYVSMPPDLALHTDQRVQRTYLVVEATECDAITEVLMTQLRRRTFLCREETTDVR